MKKKFAIVTALTLIASMLVACGGVNPDKYVTLGAYEGMEVEVSYVTYTEEDVENSVVAELDAYVDAYDMYEYTVTDEDTVSQGSIVNIDYVGTLNGEAFAGGTAEGAHLEIGSGSFIDGFEDGLVGVKVGETVDLNLTFPEDYTADLAGQDVVFTVTVNSIDLREKPEYNDEFVASLQLDPTITTYEAMKDYIRDYLQSSCDEQNKTTLQLALWNTVYETCEVSEPPQELIDEQKEALSEYYEMYAEMYGMDLETFVTSYMGTDMATYEADMVTAATEEAKIDLVYKAIAKKEGIKVTDEIINESAANEYEMYGYASVEEMLADTGAEDYEAYVLRQEVLERLAEVMVVVETEPTSLMGTY